MSVVPVAVQQMIMVPGIYKVTSPLMRGAYALVLVEENGNCHQLKILDHKKAVRDGLLLPDRWHCDTQVEKTPFDPAWVD